MSRFTEFVGNLLEKMHVGQSYESSRGTTNPDGIPIEDLELTLGFELDQTQPQAFVPQDIEFIQDGDTMSIEGNFNAGQEWSEAIAHMGSAFNNAATGEELTEELMQNPDVQFAAALDGDSTTLTDEELGSLVTAYAMSDHYTNYHEEGGPRCGTEYAVTNDGTSITISTAADINGVDILQFAEEIYMDTFEPDASEPLTPTSVPSINDASADRGACMM